MSGYMIEIDDKAITDQIGTILNAVINRELKNKYSATNEQVVAAVAQLVQERRDEIIDKAVELAADKIARRALPKLMQRLSE